MANVVYNATKKKLIDVLTGYDLRAMLVMTNTTVDTENDGVTKLSHFTTLDECDDSLYSRQALAGEATNTDDPNDRAEIDANDISFVNAGDATRNIAGVLIYRHVDGTNANDEPIVFLEYTPTKVLDGSTFVVQFDVEGFFHVRNP